VVNGRHVVFAEEVVQRLGQEIVQIYFLATFVLAFPDLHQPQTRAKGVYSVEGLEAHIRALLNAGKGKTKPKAPIKVSFGGVVAYFKDDIYASWDGFKAKMDDVIKKLKRDDLPPDMLGALIR
jgi:hypothetical protein